MRQKLHYLQVAILSFLLILTMETRAQVSDSFYLQMNHIYNHVETGRVPTGLLKDYGIDFADIKNFDGVQLSDTNIVHTNLWNDLYTSLYTYRFNNTAASVLHPDTVSSAVHNANGSGYVPLSLLFMKYDAYVDNAAAAGLVTVTNGQIYDRYINGVWQNPYTQKTVMAMSCNRDFLNTNSVTFRLPSSLTFTNYTNIQSIQGDFNDGLGWRTITPGADISVSYPDTGRKVLQFRVTLTNNQQFNSRSYLFVSFQNSGQSRFRQHLTIPIAANGQHKGGRLQVHFSAANLPFQRITRPLIIAEGFDPWKLTSNNELDNVDIDAFWDARFNYGPQLRNLLEGTYDIIYLDYNDGTDLIENNAALLRAAITEVNNRKALAGSVEQNVVLGISMGGIVSRMALRQMELSGPAHQTRLFVSLDAPFQGANVPLGLQALNTHLAGTQIKIGYLGGSIGFITTVGNVSKPLRVYHTPAAKQLLTYYLHRSTPTGPITMNNTAHNALMATLINLGYPVNCRNIAIANGSECAQSLPLLPGSDLLRLTGHYNTTFLGSLIFPFFGTLIAAYTNFPQFLLSIIPGRNDIKCSFRIRTTPSSGTAEVYNGKIWYIKKVLWLIDVRTTLTAASYTSPAGVLALDAVPGGQYAVNEVGSQVMQMFNGSFGTSFWQQLLNLFAKRGIDEYYLGSASFTFTPTPHVLDIGLGNVALTPADYTIPYRATAPPAPPKNTPFANFLTAFFGPAVPNEPHVLIESRSGTWLANELNAAPTLGDCAAMCGGQIVGPPIFCGQQQYSIAVSPGTTVTWQVTPGGIVGPPVSGPNGTVTLNRISNGNITLTAFVTGACGTYSLARPITIGTPTPVYTNVLLDPYIGRIKAWVSPVPNATSYRWYLNGALAATTTMASVTIPTVRNDCGSTYLLQVEAITVCGVSQRATEFLEAPPCMRTYVVSPNPASDQLIVEAQEKQAGAKTMSRGVSTIREMRLTDKLGTVLRQARYPGNTTRAVLNVSGLRSNHYFLHVFDGRRWTMQTVIIVN